MGQESRLLSEIREFRWLCPNCDAQVARFTTDREMKSLKVPLRGQCSHCHTWSPLPENDGSTIRVIELGEDP
jgi:hypothetical protein